MLGRQDIASLRRWSTTVPMSTTGRRHTDDHDGAYGYAAVAAPLLSLRAGRRGRGTVVMEYRVGGVRLRGRLSGGEDGKERRGSTSRRSVWSSRLCLHIPRGTCEAQLDMRDAVAG